MGLLFNRCAAGSRTRFAFAIPQAQVVEDFSIYFQNAVMLAAQQMPTNCFRQIQPRPPSIPWDWQ